MATSASYTNHFLSLLISFLVLVWAIGTMSWPYIARDLFTPDLPHSELSADILKWEARGRYVKVKPFPPSAAGESQVFTTTIKPSKAGSSSPKDVLLLVHGFPSSSYDYRVTAQSLADSGGGFEVVAFDFPGYGLSSKPANTYYSYSLLAQADVALAVWQELGLNTNGKRLHLVCHDMGVSVCQELMARRVLDKPSTVPEWFRSGLVSLTLNNGGMVVELAQLRISQILLRWPVVGPFLASIMNYPIFRAQIRSILASPDTFPESELTDMYALFQYGGGHRVATDLIGYINERYRYGSSRWLPAITQLDVPVHVLWGGRDSVAPLAIATTVKERAPNVKLTVLHESGHFAMIETPNEWMRELLAFVTPLKAATK